MIDRLDLTTEEIAFLRAALARRVDDMERELIRTDKAELQHALARDVDRLRRIAGKLQVWLEQTDAIV